MGGPRTKPFLSRMEKEISIKISRRVARTMGRGEVRNFLFKKCIPF